VLTGRERFTNHAEWVSVTTGRFTSTEVVYGVTGTDVTVLPEYGVLP